MNMYMFNIICGVCSVLGLLVSLFTASQVINIKNNFNVANKKEKNKINNNNRNSTFYGSYTGGNNNGTENNK